LTTSYCIDYNTAGDQEEHSALASNKGCTTAQLEKKNLSMKKVQHTSQLPSKILFGLKNKSPEQPLESCILHMEED